MREPKEQNVAADEVFDLVVIGGGLGGLATAALARTAGLRVALLEAHTKLGGCAGHFGRGPYHFDAGATALMGLGPGEPLGDLLGRIGLDLQGLKTPSYRVHLPDRTLDIVPDGPAFETACQRAFPGHPRSLGLFWKLQEAVGRRLFAVASRGPRFPPRSFGDTFHDLKILGVGGLLAASTSSLTVQNVLRMLGLNEDRPFRSLVAMLLQDTAQAGPEVVPFANASACLHAYRSGMSRPIGGMAALAEGIGRRFAELGGSLHVATKVDRVREDVRGGFAVETRRRRTFLARQVAFNLPVDLAASLLGRTLGGQLRRDERKSRAAWSAFTGYLAIDRAAIPDDGPLFHQVLRDYDRPIHDGNNVLVSLSPPGDPGYGPPDVRVATLSTHVRPDEWVGLEKPEHAARKAEFRGRLLDVVELALPGSVAGLRHEEFATPRSFARYTRRARGAVGGAPVGRFNSNVLAVGPDALGRGLWLVGDSVFPGQGTMAVVLSAREVVRRITLG